MGLKPAPKTLLRAGRYDGSTTGMATDFHGCGRGNAVMFFIELQPGQGISIGQMSNAFDSKHAVMWGASLAAKVNMYCPSYTSRGTTTLAQCKQYNTGHGVVYSSSGGTTRACYSCKSTSSSHSSGWTLYTRTTGTQRSFAPVRTHDSTRDSTHGNMTPT